MDVTNPARDAAENLRAIQLAIRDEEHRHADALEQLRLRLFEAQKGMRAADPEWAPPRAPWDPPIDAWHP